MSRYLHSYACYCHVFLLDTWAYYGCFVLLQSLEDSGMRSVGNLLDPRKRVDERSLEKEEEDYFNEERYPFTYYFVELFLFW